MRPGGVRGRLGRPGRRRPARPVASGHRGAVTISLSSTWSEDEAPPQRPADVRREWCARGYGAAGGLRRPVGDQQDRRRGRPGAPARGAERGREPVSQTATVGLRPGPDHLAQLRGWVRDCGYHCAGQSVPDHVCDPMAEPAAAADHPDARRTSRQGAPAAATAARRWPHRTTRWATAATAACRWTPWSPTCATGSWSPLVLSIPILLWSPIGARCSASTSPAPFGLRDDVFALLLSLPVVFYSAWIFFDGACRALRARTLDMMVLVAVAVGAGWLYSRRRSTLTGGGEVFYEAATVLTAFVLLGHWFEMRARGGANDAIRTLLDLAPPKAVVLRDGEPVEVPTAEVVVGRPAAGPARVEDPGRRRRRGRREPRSTSPWSPARACRCTRRRATEVIGATDQHQRHAAGPGHQGRRGHRAGADRRAGAGGAELQGARAAAGRPGRVLAGAGRARSAAR